MPAPKTFTRADLLRAMQYTKSVRSLAKYLSCSYQHVKPYMKSIVTGKQIGRAHV